MATKSKPATKKSKKRHLPKARVYVKASYNNTVITVTDMEGNVVAWSSAGTQGFNGPKKATPFASSKVIATLSEKLKPMKTKELEVYVRGIGGGRDSAMRSLIAQGFDITLFKDVTPMPHNGPRQKKARRV